MPYRICKTFEIENGHMLSKHPDLCKFPHGHTRRVELIVEAEHLDQNEMVCDFKVFKEILADYLNSLDHALCMNTDDPNFKQLKAAFGDRVVPFHGQDPTTEVLAKAVYERLQTSLAAYMQSNDPRYPVRAKLRVVKVRVWETTSSWAEYFEGGND